MEGVGPEDCPTVGCTFLSIICRYCGPLGSPSHCKPLHRIMDWRKREMEPSSNVTEDKKPCHTGTQNPTSRVQISSPDYVIRCLYTSSLVRAMTSCSSQSVSFTSVLVIIDGDVCPYRPDFFKDSLSDTSQGRFVTSVSRVKYAGHMVRQKGNAHWQFADFKN